MRNFESEYKEIIHIDKNVLCFLLRKIISHIFYQEFK